MENPKKRSRASSEPKSKKKVKIETAAGAVKALDDIVLGPLPLPMKMEMGVADETSKIPGHFFDNHAKMFLATTGYDVYMNSCINPDIKTPLKDDIKSLMVSHDRWEMIARKLRAKCVELKRDIALLWQSSSPVPPVSSVFPTL